MKTPWGNSDSISQVVPGIIQVSTPSHGGYRVAQKLLDTMPEHLRNADGWYEEDCEAAKVVIAFPWAFSREALTNSVKIYQHYFTKEKAHA